MPQGIVQDCCVLGCVHEPSILPAVKVYAADDERRLLELMRRGQEVRETERQVFYANLRRSLRC